MKKLFLLMTTVLIMTISAVAQHKVVSGTVVYAGDDEPLPGATVLPVGGGQGTSTDLDGKFTLNVPASVTKLKVSYVGMIEKIVDAGKDITVKLDNSENNLDEVMVVAYGTAKKSAYTGSASVVKAEQLEQRQVTNAVNALAGTVAGAQIIQTSGQPGTSPSVYIRGVGSLSTSAQPLYVVDGMPFDGDIAALNTADIESMTVLKDAAAAALYGARGANGVILITTKKGKSGDAVVTVDAKWGGNSRQVKGYDVIKDPAQYTEMAYTALRNGYYYHNNYDAASAHSAANASLYNAFGAGYQIWTVPAGQQMVGTNGKLNPNATLGYSNGTNYFTPDNWADETFRTGLRQEYNVTISGGSDRFTFYGSFGYLGDEGVIQGSNYNRLSGRVGADYQAKKWLKVGTNIAYNHVESGWPSGQEGDGGTASNAFNLCNNIAPIYPMYVRNADGTLQYDSRSGYPVYDLGDGKYALGTSRNYMSGGNPQNSLLYDKEDILMDVLSAKWYATITPVTNLDITGTVGYFLDNTRQHVISNPYYNSSTITEREGMAEQYFSRLRGLNLQALATYRHTVADVHHLDYLLGYESYDRNSEYLYGYGYTLYNPNNWAVNNTLDNSLRVLRGGNDINYTTRGIFGRVNYDYDSRYFGSVSYRRDASSRFAPDKRWGNFFSLSAAWDLAKEKFMESTSSWLDLLKVKASFGQQGNDNLGSSYYYAYLDTYTIYGSDSWSDGDLYSKGNPDLTWETSNALNVGADFSFWQGKLAGTIEYFQRQTSDMLYNKPVAPSLGYSYYPMNVGSMRNNGIEIELTYRPINTRNVTWDLNFNGTWIQNKILKLSPDANGRILQGMRIWEEGKSAYNYYLVEYAGVNPENGEPLYWTKDPIYDTVDESKIVGYTEEYKTNNYDNAYANNRKDTGNLLPTFYGGFGTTVKFFGFDFSCQFGFQLGGRTFDNGYGALMHPGTTSSLGTNWHTDMLKAWTPENTNTNIPKLDTQASYDLGSQVTTFNLISSNYLSLNNITLGYTLPSKWTAKLGIESVRVYGVADNVALWSKRKGLDPRMSSFTATDSYSGYSVIRTVSGGIKVVF
jgi:TonB-linked SusC/RagA family outer membrane protein